jgi:hypothetical protein
MTAAFVNEICMQRGEGIPEIFKKSKIFLGRYKDIDAPETGDQRSEIRSQRSEVRNQRSEVRDRRSETHWPTLKEVF